MIRLQSLVVTLVLLGFIVGRANAEVPKIIFDTDITSDLRHGPLVSQFPRVEREDS